MRFFRRHQAKFAIGFAILAVALLTAHRQITDEITKLVPGPKGAPEKQAQPAPHPQHHKGVNVDSGNHTPSSGLPGPSSGGPQQTPSAPETPQEPVSPPRTPVPLGPLEPPICTLTGALNVPVCH